MHEQNCGGCRKSRQKAWRAALGASVDVSGAARNGTPTRLAYRWLKGEGGWAKGTLGDAAENDAAPPEDDIETDGEEADASQAAHRTIRPGTKSGIIAPRSAQAEVQ